MNLNGILSSRVVAPRQSFGKYYTDLLQQSPGWVPLLRDVPTRDQIEVVTSERGAGSPVLIEFPRGAMEDDQPGEEILFAPAVALSEAVAIHLPSEGDLREHKARAYGNVQPHDQILVVTPELFQRDASAESTLSTPSPAPDIDWRAIDRVRGAINAAIASADSGQLLVHAAALLGVQQLPAATRVPQWFSSSHLVDSTNPDERPTPDSSQPDHVLFRAAYDVLGGRDVSESWRPNEVLDSVESIALGAPVTSDGANLLVRNINRVRSILNVEVDFEPFRPSAQGLVSAKALLLVLLRPDLRQLLTWPAEETGADDATRVVAAALAGRLRGLARESTDLRSLALDDLTAAWAVRVAHGGAPILDKAQLVANNHDTSLIIDSVQVAVQGAL